MSIYWIDYAVIAILAYCTLFGFIRGFALEVLGLLALVIASCLSLAIVDAAYPALRETSLIAGLLDRSRDNPHIESSIRLVIYFIGLSVAAPLMSRISSGYGASVYVGPSGQFFGAVIGLAKGCVYLIAFYLIAELIVSPINWPREWHRSQSLPMIHDAVKVAASMLPTTMRPDVQSPFRPDFEFLGR